MGLGLAVCEQSKYLDVSSNAIEEDILDVVTAAPTRWVVTTAPAAAAITTNIGQEKERGIKI